MNTTIHEFAQTQTDTIQKASLMMLASFASDHFLDLPKLPEDRFAQNGLFYKLQCAEHARFSPLNKKRMLLVVYKVHDYSSMCPMRMEIDITDDDFAIYVIDQSSDQPKKRVFVGRNEQGYFSQIENHQTVTLSELTGQLINA